MARLRSHSSRYSSLLLYGFKLCGLGRFGAVLQQAAVFYSRVGPRGLLEVCYAIRVKEEDYYNVKCEQFSTHARTSPLGVSLMGHHRGLCRSSA